MRNRNQIVALSLVLALASPALVACGGGQAAEQEGSGQSEQQQAGVPNPFVDCTSAYEAAQLAGFEVTFPESVPGYSQRLYQAIEGQMAQCFYSEGEQRVLVRKAVDDGSGDISGDYNEYDEVSKADVEGTEVTEKGTGGLVYCAIWSKDGYLFAIDADAGLESDVIESLVAATF